MKPKKPIDWKKLIIRCGKILFVLFLLLFSIGAGLDISDLQDENARLASELSIASAKANATDEMNRNITDAIGRLEAFKQDIADTTKWFKDNSNIAGLKEYDVDRTAFDERCLVIEKDSCRIKLGCPSWIFKTMDFFSYKIDNETSNKSDYLQDLSSFYRKKGGDCEDYSLAVGASINFMEDACKKRGYPKYFFEAITDSVGSIAFIDNIEDWRYIDATVYELPKDYTYHYTVCGDFPSGIDPNTKEGANYSGHCVLAFTNAPITGSAGIRDSLKDSILVEPQSGWLVYDLRFEDSMIVPYDGYTYYDMRNLIYSVITDSDYYIFKRYGSEAYWMGYSDFLPMIDTLEKSLPGLRSGA